MDLCLSKSLDCAESTIRPSFVIRQLGKRASCVGLVASGCPDVDELPFSSRRNFFRPRAKQLSDADRASLANLFVGSNLRVDNWLRSMGASLGEEQVRNGLTGVEFKTGASVGGGDRTGGLASASTFWS